MTPAHQAKLPIAQFPFRIRVAIVGAGPAAFYAAVELLRGDGVLCQVDMFDRLPTPYGLVRTGVAPDRMKVKTVTRKYEAELEEHMARYRLFCNVEVGRDVTLDELKARYDAVILATGARAERKIGIAGEELDRVYSGSSFAAWYNGHPEHRDDHFDLHGERAVVVGMGNVALDVARLLCRTRDELVATDIADHAMDHLDASGLESIVVLGRSGPAQAAFTPDELEQLTKLEDADLVVDPRDLELDPTTQAELDAGRLPRRVTENLRLLRTRALAAPRPGRRHVQLRFWVSPEEIVGQAGAVGGIRLHRNRPVTDASGKIRPQATEHREDLSCHAVFRAVGSALVPTHGVPFDMKTGLIPHERGQVLESPGGRAVAGLFVAGWAKRGATGIIATNKIDAVETVESIREAHSEGRLPATCRSLSVSDVSQVLEEREVKYITFADWKVLDGIELAAGEQAGRPRRKLTDVEEMLAAIASR